MVGRIEGVNCFELRPRYLSLLSDPPGIVKNWRHRSKLRADVEAWMFEMVGEGGYWTYDPAAHGMKWSLEHSNEVIWDRGNKYYAITHSGLTFTDADKAMLFKLTWL